MEEIVPQKKELTVNVCFCCLAVNPKTFMNVIYIITIIFSSIFLVMNIEFFGRYHNAKSNHDFYVQEKDQTQVDFYAKELALMNEQMELMIFPKDYAYSLMMFDILIDFMFWSILLFVGISFCKGIYSSLPTTIWVYISLVECVFEVLVGLMVIIYLIIKTVSGSETSISLFNFAWQYLLFNLISCYITYHLYKCYKFLCEQENQKKEIETELQA